MANIKIAQLTNQINISDTDLILIESATSTNKMTVGKLKELLGISSGGIVESGSNSNGSYIKFGDGTMVCYHNMTMDDWVSIPRGALYSTSSKVWTFPVPFALTPTVTSQVNSMIPNTWTSLGTGGSNRFDTSVRVMGTVIDGSAQYIPSVSLIAIGRWK